MYRGNGESDNVIWENPDYVNTPCNVTVMLHDRAYGGPEEGGWYYDTDERIEHHYAANLSTLSRIMRRVQEDYSNEGRYPVSSVLSDGVYRIYVGDYIPENYPDYRPHYE